MPVKIDMDMPKNCIDCKISLATSDSCFCPILGKVTGGDYGLMKNSKCPLQEVKGESMEKWKIGDKCYMRMYGARYGEGKFLVYEAKVIRTQGNRFIVEAPAMQALRAGYELYKTKEEALGD